MTHHSPLEVSGGDQLDRYTYKLQRGRKVDLTSKNGYLRGRWVTVMPTGTDFPMNLAEIRVYGSKCLILLGPGRPSAGGPRWDRHSNTVTHATLRACGAQLGGSV